MRFWKVTSRILRGVKRVGGLGARAVPAGGHSNEDVSDCFVKEHSEDDAAWSLGLDDLCL